MEETTTEVVGESGAVNALPVQPTEATAENQSQAQEGSQEEGATALPTTDEKLVKFAESHGIQLDSESAIKAAKIAMDNQASYQQAQSKASQLEKSLQTQPVDNVTDVQQLKNDLALMKFKSETPDWQQYEPAMVAKLSENVMTPDGVFPRSELVKYGYMTLSDVYAMAKGSNVAPQEKVEDVLQSIANKQRAGGVSANAVNSAPSAKVDPIMEAIQRSRGQS